MAHETSTTESATYERSASAAAHAMLDGGVRRALTAVATLAVVLAVLWWFVGPQFAGDEAKSWAGWALPPLMLWFIEFFRQLWRQPVAALEKERMSHASTKAECVRLRNELESPEHRAKRLPIVLDQIKSRMEAAATRLDEIARYTMGINVDNIDWTRLRSSTLPEYRDARDDATRCLTQSLKPGHAISVLALFHWQEDPDKVPDEDLETLRMRLCGASSHLSKSLRSKIEELQSFHLKDGFDGWK
jgi:hypothetical protein